MTRAKRLSVKSLCICWIAALFLIAALPLRAASANGSQVYFNDFDGKPIVAPGVTAALGGITTEEEVLGYAGLGTGSNTFGGEFLRNATGGDFGSSGSMGTPGLPTTLTLTNLPPHIGIEINFLLAIIDSWDGGESGEPGGCCNPDLLTVLVDGKIVFSEAFGYNRPAYNPPPGGMLVEYAPLGFNPGFDDSAYDMGLESTFDDIPHMADTLTIEWFASGDGWQGGMDESWAIDNLEIVLHGGQPVALDVKPQGCPNPINALAKGVIPVAVLGTGDLDVTLIDVDSLRLEGVAPVRSAIEDVGTPFEPYIGKNEALDCTDSGPDGFQDLTLKFDTQELVGVLGNVEDGQVRTLTLRGSLLDGTAIRGQDAIVIVASNDGTISGTVVDDSGTPVAGIWVDACDESVPEDMWGQSSLCNGSHTDENGDYAIPDLLPGNYRVVIWGDLSYVPEFYDDAPTYDDAERVPVTAGKTTQDIDFVLTVAGSIAGTVTNDSGAPVADIWVDACDESVPEDMWGSSIWCNGTHTDENGDYAIPSLAPGNYRVVIWGGPSSVGEFYDDAPTYDQASLVPVTGGQTTPGIDFVLAVAGSIAGTVTDDSAAPVAGIWVDACQADNPDFCYCGQTDENGFYTIASLVPGEYRVVIWDPSYVDEFYDDAPTYDQASLVPVTGGQTTPNIDFALAVAGSIAGTVTDDSGAPVADIWVDACQADNPDFCYCGQTDENGFYTIASLVPGEYRVVIWDPSYVDEFYDDAPTFEDATLVLVTGGQTTPNIDFALAVAGSIAGTVTDDSGAPVADIWVDACEESVPEDMWGSSIWCNGTHTDANGDYAIPSLAPGNYRVVIWGGPFYIGEFYADAPTYDQATLVPVTGGQTTPGIDFDLAVPGG